MKPTRPAANVPPEDEDDHQGLTPDEVATFVEDFIGHQGGYLVPWDSHDRIVAILRRAGIREREWYDIRNDGKGTPGAYATMLRFLPTLTPARQADVLETIRDHLQSGRETRWPGPPFPGAERDVAAILTRLRGVPLELQSPEDAWPDTQRKVEKARKALQEHDPHRAVELLYPAVRPYVDKIMGDHAPQIRRHGALDVSLQRVFSEHIAFATGPEWQETVDAIRDGLAISMSQAHKVRSAGTDAHERGPSRPYDPEEPIGNAEAYLVAELMIVVINYLHRKMQGYQSPARTVA